MTVNPVKCSKKLKFSKHSTPWQLSNILTVPSDFMYQSKTSSVGNFKLSDWSYLNLSVHIIYVYYIILDIII